MLDFHTHILPEIDDGSASVKQSEEMLTMLSGQHVDKIVFTPHFYAEDETPESFFRRRDESYQKLLPLLKEKFGDIDFRLSAEVCYYIGVSALENIERFCVEKTPLFLLEMPRCRWDAGMLSEIRSLARQEKVIVVLVHIDRYFDFNPLRTFEDLSREGVLMQVNCDYLANKNNKRRIRKLFRRGIMNFIGTDCHNTDDRKPNYKEAVLNLQKLFDDEAFGILGFYEEEFFD